MKELKILFQTYARYNQAMNAQIYVACSKLRDEERRRNGGAWFKSIHGTLNHILLADKAWLGRFTGEPFVVAALDTELFETWDELRSERVAFDERLIAWIDALEAERLRENLTFQPMSRPGPVTLPLWLAATHLWNHQTHHRGQATTLMNALGADSGVSDLPAIGAVAAFAGEHPL